MNDNPREWSLDCPVRGAGEQTIQMAHGGGGRATARLIESLFLPAFGNPALLQRHDGAVVELSGPTAFSTDTYVVDPLFFPGGDIGTLAVNGTVNDLAMCGARPLYLSAGFILEEGLPLETLENVVLSMRRAARAARVQIVTGDIKVVDRGKADGLFINSAGVGHVLSPAAIAPRSIRPGDAIIVSGDIGRHGIAVMAAREQLGLETAIESDCAPVADPALSLIQAGVSVHCLRDLTRGGLASALVEIAEAAGLALDIDETSIPLRAEVTAACELLGFDPIYVANEGRFIAIVPAHQAERSLALLRGYPVAKHAAVIGKVSEEKTGQVRMKTAIGATRLVDMLSGEQLPRIC